MSGTMTTKLSSPYSAARECAERMDAENPLKQFRAQFNIPSKADLESTVLPPEERGSRHDQDPAIYLCGNQIGLQPLETPVLVGKYLDTWATQGMLGLGKKMAGSPLPTWGEADTVAAELTVPIVGAVAGEVSVMGGLTTNLHVLMASFYRPSGVRTKIMIERDTFSSDYYAVQSQIQLHGLDIQSNLVTIEPNSPSSSDTPYLLSTSRILAAIDKHGPTTALLLLSGVQYVSGQVLAMQEITAHAQTHGILVGWDLAHAVGNIELRLHDWGVDFAVWCNYKFMNAGPGAIGGIFVHERHGRVDRDRGVYGYRPRLAGWWGNEMGSRFNMESTFVPCIGSAGYQLSNASVMDTVALIASLQVFQQTDMTTIQQVSRQLTGYLEYLLLRIDDRPFGITVSDPAERGAQLAVKFDNKDLLDQLMGLLRAKGIVVAQKGDVMRVAPVALYNTFIEVWTFVEELRQAIAAQSK